MSDIELRELLAWLWEERVKDTDAFERIHQIVFDTVGVFSAEGAEINHLTSNRLAPNDPEITTRIRGILGL